MNRFEAASHDYLPRGWMPVPIPLKEKNPGFKGWQKYNPQDGQLERDFRSIGNIGLLLGKPSNGLIDIDLDWPEACALALKFLPSTEMKSGRDGAPFSHWWFISENARTEKWIDPNKPEDGDRAMIVELRSTGGQTVVAPSIHPSGESYIWHSELNPAKTDAAPLKNALARLAACALITRYWPNGGRHDAALALAGVLFRNGWTRNDVSNFILSAASAAFDNELEDRARAIADTEERLKAGETATGLPTLVEIFGVKTIDKVVKWLELRSLTREQTNQSRRTYNGGDQATDDPSAEEKPDEQSDAGASSDVNGIAPLLLFDNELNLQFKALPRGNVSVDVESKGKFVHQDELYLSRYAHRVRFIKKIAKLLSFTEEQQAEIEKALLIKSKKVEKFIEKERNAPTIKAFNPTDVYNPYEIQDGKLIWLKPIAGSGEFDGLTQPITLTNFIAEITGDVIRDDGTEPIRVLEVEVEILGEPGVRKGTVKASEFSAMRWPVTVAGSGAVIYAGKVEHARTAVQLLSKNKKTRRVVAHTGWRKEGEEFRFYHSGGAIAASGLVQADVELPPALTPCVLPAPPTGARLREVVRAVAFELPRVAPDRIMLPLIGCVFVAVLTGGDFSLFLLGTTGKGKTELLILAQSFFGAGFNEKNIPANWGSTPYSIQGITHLAKDIACGVDDFVPKGTHIEQAKLHAKAEIVLRGQANSSGRARCNPDGSVRPERPPRGVIISTGEDIPRGQSLVARMLATEVKQGDVDWTQLTLSQKKRREGVFAEATSAFLQWLATDNRIEELQKKAADKIHELRTEWAKTGHDIHKKASNTLAQLQRAWDTWLDFAKQCGAIDEDEAVRIYDAVGDALDAAGREQARFLANENPAARFIELLKAALSSGKAHVASTTNGTPDDPAIWGWRDAEVPTMNGPRTEWRPLGDRIGWTENDSVYLQPDAAYKMAQAMGANGEGLTISSQTLRKRLKEEGLLASIDEKRQTNKVRKAISDQTENVIHIWVKSFFPANDLG